MEVKNIMFVRKLWLKKRIECDTISSYRYGHTMPKFRNGGE